MSKSMGTIFLPTWSAIALWDHELVGQISDGMWENTRPHDHWEFWCDLKSELGTPPRVETMSAYNCKKDSYSFSSLYPIVGDRMLAIGRMGRASSSRDDHAAAHYLSELEPEQFTAKSWPSYMDNYLKDVSVATYCRFCATTYTMKDLKKDIHDIKVAMKTVRGFQTHSRERILTPDNAHRILSRPLP